MPIAGLDYMWQSVLSCIQYCTHMTSVLFCGLNNDIRILVNRLNNPVFVLPVTDMSLFRDCSRIELPCLSIDDNQFGQARD